MNTDIEDFIKTKNKMGLDEYNNIDVDKYDHDKCKIIKNNLLECIYQYKTSNSNIDIDIVKLFEEKLSKQMRLAKITNLRKSILS